MVYRRSNKAPDSPEMRNPSERHDDNDPLLTSNNEENDEFSSSPPPVIMSPLQVEKPKEDPTSNPSKIAAVVAFYFCISIALVFLNKILLSKGDFEYPFPLAVTFFQLSVSLVCCYIMSIVGSKFETFSFIPPWEFELERVPKFLKLSTCFVLQLIFNNLCLQFVEVSFYQVARSLTILFNILFTYLIMKETTSRNSLYACGIVFVGYVLGSMGEVRFSTIGVVFGLISSAFVSLNAIYVKMTLSEVQGNQWKLQVYNNVLSLVILIPITLVSGEFPACLRVPFLFDPKFVGMMTITALFGYLINIAIFLQIKYTSPLTNNLSGTAKACVQTLLSVILFKNPISGLNAFGATLAIAGSFIYSQVRQAEMRAKAALAKIQTSPPPSAAK